MKKEGKPWGRSPASKGYNSRCVWECQALFFFFFDFLFPRPFFSLEAPCAQGSIDFVDSERGRASASRGGSRGRGGQKTCPPGALLPLPWRSLEAPCAQGICAFCCCARGRATASRGREPCILRAARGAGRPSPAAGIREALPGGRSSSRGGEPCILRTARGVSVRVPRRGAAEEKRTKAYPPGAPEKKRSEGIVFFSSGDVRAQRMSSPLDGGASLPTARSVRLTSRAATRPMITPLAVPLTISTGR